jgi:predicted  nucleic acid-binding Zn-ribbon protein
MIDENFVQSAIKIRRTYLKLTNNMDLYKSHIEKLTDNLDEIVGKLSELQSQLNDTKSGDKITTESAVSELTKILSDLEQEGTNLEKAVNPINEEIEKLSLEEAELWRNIKEKNYDIPEDNIIEYIKTRLKNENLSN